MKLEEARKAQEGESERERVSWTGTTRLIFLIDYRTFALGFFPVALQLALAYSMVSPSHPTSDLLPLLPLPLPSFLSFLSTPLATSLTNSATNDFFAFAPLTADGKGSVVLRRGSEGCWGRLPGDWREYFEGVGEREQLLKDLANGRWERVSSLSLAGLFGAHSLRR